MIVYVIHPAVLVVLRAAAEVSGLTGILVENTFVQFLSVSAVSFAAAALLLRIRSALKLPGTEKTGRTFPRKERREKKE